MTGTSNTAKGAPDAHIVKARAAIGAAIAQHGKGVLQFSGGASSLACLYLARPWWDRILVLWANAGDEYPESRAQMDQVKAMVPYFREIRGNAATEQRLAGLPVDMLPGRATWIGRYMHPDEVHRPMVLAGECCSRNWWIPLGNFVQQSGLKLAIRGQRKATRSSELTDGASLDGMTYSLPVEAWTSDQVMSYLAGEQVPMPAQYAYGMGSLKCLHCTGNLDEGAGRLRYLRDHHPAASAEVVRRLRIVDQAQRREAQVLSALLAEVDDHASGAQRLPEVD